MRNPSVAQRAPRSIGLPAYTAFLRPSMAHDAVDLGRDSSHREALALCVFLLCLRKHRMIATHEEPVNDAAPNEVTEHIDLTSEQDWRMWEQSRIDRAHERERRHWTSRAAMPDLAVQEFNEVIKSIDRVDESLHRFTITDRALGDFIRHFFAYSRKVGHFCEWMAESPDLCKQTLYDPYGVKRFSQLETTDKRAVRHEMRLLLQESLKALIAYSELGHGKNAHREQKTEVRILNISTRERFCAVLDRENYMIIAFYPESERNRKRAYKSPRQFDIRLKSHRNRKEGRLH
ncbi:MAG: hypothetical protein KC582_01550 [Candidatus Magasanikbacteria bacterium]|nr:hypothetical protein [Candidatus Magasanikbacteria bacterium]MCA9389336.1 hypothetical protein [Candidatus Magasanikbacteria bacterium]MCA9390917.1 hypothetical protein [Candidatus Magasanikbacteria bacterium]HPF95293.1 hypothetical protein [bacterium]